jgi:pheromone shutdown protein TraB
VGVLKATGSTDPDVLYAAKEEYGSTFATQRFQGLGFLITGVLASLTIIMAIIGVPVAIFGWWFWQKGKRNVALVEAAYSQYLASLKPAAAMPAAATLAS